MKTREPGTLLTSAATLRGTEISKKRRTEPTDSLAGAMGATSSALIRIDSEPEATNTTSAVSTQGIRSGISRMSKSTSGKSAANCSARGNDRLSSVTFVQPCPAEKYMLDTVVRRITGKGA